MNDLVASADDGRVAQVVEQCPFKAWVAGSNPAALTKLALQNQCLLVDRRHRPTSLLKIYCRVRRIGRCF